MISFKFLCTHFLKFFWFHPGFSKIKFSVVIKTVCVLTECMKDILANAMFAQISSLGDP